MIATQARDVETNGCDGTYRLRPEVLDALMATKGIRSVAAQARAFGIHRATLFRLRAGTTAVTLDLAMRLARGAGTSVEALFGQPTNPPPPGPTTPKPPNAV